MKLRRGFGLIALAFGWAACGAGSSGAAAVPSAAGRPTSGPTSPAATSSPASSTASTAPLAAGTGGNTKIPDGTETGAAPVAPPAPTAETAPATAEAPAAAPSACATPVACAGTLSGSWCVDTFFPAESSSPEFGGVWSSGPNDVWAVGWRNTAQQSDVDGFAFHWDGCAWSPAAITTSAGLNDVWGASANDVWVVGAQGTALHWNGSAWTAAPTGTSGTFNHVSGSGAGDVWTIGNAGLYHWEGSAWTADTRLAINAQDGFLGDLWAVSPNDVWVAEGLNARGSVAHYDGTAWTVSQPSPEVDFGLFGIWSSGASTWAVGAGTQVMRNTAGTWTQVKPPGGSSQGWINTMGSGTELWASGQSVARSTGDTFEKDTEVPAGFYPGLWLNESQVWVAGITNAGKAVVMHRAR